MNCVPFTSESPSFAWSVSGSQPGALERLQAGEPVAAEPRLALADQWQREMRERRQVTAGTDRAAARHDGQHAAVETGEQELDELGPRTGPPLRERVGTEHHRCADHLVRIGLADSAGVASQQSQLQLLGQLLRDRLRDEAPEAGVDPVRVLAAAVRGAIDDGPRLDHPLPGRFGQRHGRPSDRDRPHVVDGQVLAREADRRSRGHPPSLASRSTSPLPPGGGAETPCTTRYRGLRHVSVLDSCRNRVSRRAA